MWIVIYVLRERTLRIRVGQRIQVYDIKTRLAYGGHGVCAEQLNTLKKKIIIILVASRGEIYSGVGQNCIATSREISEK